MGLIRCECGSVRESAHPACPGCGRCPSCGEGRVTHADLVAPCVGCGVVCCDTCGRCHHCGIVRFANLGPCSCGFPTPEKIAEVEQLAGPAHARSAGCLGVVLVVVIGAAGLWQILTT